MYSGFGLPDCTLTDMPHLLHLSAAPLDFLRFSLTSPLLLSDSSQHNRQSRPGKAEPQHASVLTKPSGDFPFQPKQTLYLQALLDHSYLLSVPATPFIASYCPLSFSVPTTVSSQAHPAHSFGQKTSSLRDGQVSLL